jgi:hypothetical protein
MFSHKEIIEGVKQLLRIALIAVLPLIISDLSSQSFNWKAWLIAGVIAILSGIDKLLHEADSKNEVTKLLELKSIK